MTYQNRPYGGLPLATAAMLCSFIALFLVARPVYLDIVFNQSIGGYLSRAANASTVPQALQSLDVAITNIEARRMTSGDSSVVYSTPNTDVGFWYQNLKASQDEMRSLQNPTPTEQSNVLMKLRETVLDHGEKGDVLAVPGNIAAFPNQVSTTFGAIFGIFLAFLVLSAAVVVFS